MNNIMEVKFLVIFENESLVRVIVVFFVVKLDLIVDELVDIKIVVFEVVMNVIIYGYEEDSFKFVFLRCEIEGNIIKIIVEDEGYGIENVEKVMELFYILKLEFDRLGMGFIVMKSFMDDVEVSFVKDNGIRIEMIKKINVFK